jgi:hypothetical protein
MQVLTVDVFRSLAAVDAALAAEAKAGGCPSCGGRLDRADYARSVRGLPQSAKPFFEKRHSLCCAVEGCRRRLTPPSVRFAGRRVHAAAIVVLAVLCERARQVAEVSTRTVRRWRRFWREEVPVRPEWAVVRGLAFPLREDLELPLSLWDRFTGSDTDRLLNFLRFMTPMLSAS